MEALINRTPYLMLLAVTGLFLFGGAAVHAQSESPLKTTVHDKAADPAPDDEGDTSVTLDNQSEPEEVNGTDDPDLQSAIEAQQQLADDFALAERGIVDSDDLSSQLSVGSKRELHVERRVAVGLDLDGEITVRACE